MFEEHIIPSLVKDIRRHEEKTKSLTIYYIHDGCIGTEAEAFEKHLI